eukprot:976876_1
MATGNISSKFPRSNLSRPETLRKLSNSLKPKKRRQSLSTELSTFDFPSQTKSSEIENDTRESAENDDKSHPKRNFGASKICLNVATKRTHPKHIRSGLGSACSSIDTTSGIGFPKPSPVRKVPKSSKTEKSAKIRRKSRGKCTSKSRETSSHTSKTHRNKLCREPDKPLSTGISIPSLKQCIISKSQAGMDINSPENYVSNKSGTSHQSNSVGLSCKSKSYRQKTSKLYIHEMSHESSLLFSPPRPNSKRSNRSESKSHSVGVNSTKHKKSKTSLKHRQFHQLNESTDDISTDINTDSSSRPNKTGKISQAVPCQDQFSQSKHSKKCGKDRKIQPSQASDDMSENSSLNANLADKRPKKTWSSKFKILSKLKPIKTSRNRRKRSSINTPSDVKKRPTKTTKFDFFPG